MSAGKTGQNRLNKQNCDKLVNHLPEKLLPACNWTEISLLERQILSSVVQLGDSNMLKLLGINPEIWGEILR